MGLIKSIGDENKELKQNISTLQDRVSKVELSNWKKIEGIIPTPTTTTLSNILMPDMQIDILTSGNPLEIHFNCILESDGDVDAEISLFINNQEAMSRSVKLDHAFKDFSLTLVSDVPQGENNIKIYWKKNSGVGFIKSLSSKRTLTAKEL